VACRLPMAGAVIEDGRPEANAKNSGLPFEFRV
jgi:hypothetical protein